MIHSIFIFHSRSGLKLWNKIFTEIKGEPDIITGFFYTIKEFVLKVLLDTCSNLTILSDNCIIKFKLVHSIEAYIVIKADKSDELILPELIEEMKDILLNHDCAFKEWRNKFLLNEFDILDSPISDLVEDFYLDTIALNNMIQAET